MKDTYCQQSAGENNLQGLELGLEEIVTSVYSDIEGRATNSVTFVVDFVSLGQSMHLQVGNAAMEKFVGDFRNELEDLRENLEGLEYLQKEQQITVVWEMTSEREEQQDLPRSMIYDM